MAHPPCTTSSGLRVLVSGLHVPWTTFFGEYQTMDTDTERVQLRDDGSVAENTELPRSQPSASKLMWVSSTPALYLSVPRKSVFPTCWRRSSRSWRIRGRSSSHLLCRVRYVTWAMSQTPAIFYLSPTGVQSTLSELRGLGRAVKIFDLDSVARYALFLLYLAARQEGHRCVWLPIDVPFSWF